MICSYALATPFSVVACFLAWLTGAVALAPVADARAANRPVFAPITGLSGAVRDDSSGEPAGRTVPLFTPLTNSERPENLALLSERGSAAQGPMPALGAFTTVAAADRPAPALLRPPDEPFTLGPGDRLDIQLIGDPASLNATVVGPDGKVYFNLLPGLDVWGLTPAEAKALMEREFLKFMREKPQVGITLRSVESQQVWLLGRLHHPGVYPLTTPMSLLEALTRAGGPMSPVSLASLGGGPLGANFSQDFADLRRSFVIRDARRVPVDFYALLKQGDLSQNIYLRPGDFVYLPSAVTQEIFVLGAVAEPRSVSYRERMTLVMAIANAQGTIKDAHLSHVAIVRGSLSQPKVSIINYREVIRGQQPDVLLQAGDIVYVPFSPFRTVERYVNLILNTFVTTVGINEGARAVTRNFEPVGVSIGGGAPSAGQPAPPP